MVKRTDVVWYAMRITYSRELALKEYLDSISVEFMFRCIMKRLPTRAKNVVN